MTPSLELELLLSEQLVNTCVTIKRAKPVTIMVDRVVVHFLHDNYFLILFCKDNRRYEFILDNFANHIL